MTTIDIHQNPYVGWLGDLNGTQLEDLLWLTRWVEENLTADVYSAFYHHRRGRTFIGEFWNEQDDEVDVLRLRGGDEAIDILVAHPDIVIEWAADDTEGSDDGDGWAYWTIRPSRLRELRPELEAVRDDIDYH